MAPLQHELGKKRPFEEPAQELFLSIMRTAATIETPVAEVLHNSGLSGATYNVLRILRGATLEATLGANLGEKPQVEVTCGHIAKHLVSPVPDVTRLIDRLEKLKLASRRRSTDDRRVVYVQITQAGLDLLATLDEPILDCHRRQFAHLGKPEIAELIRLLERARDDGTAAAGVPIPTSSASTSSGSGSGSGKAVKRSRTKPADVES